MLLFGRDIIISLTFTLNSDGKVLTEVSISVSVNMAANQTVRMDIDGFRLVNLANGVWGQAEANNYISLDNYKSFEHIMCTRNHFKSQNLAFNTLQLARDLTIFDSQIIDRVA